MFSVSLSLRNDQTMKLVRERGECKERLSIERVPEYFHKLVSKMSCNSITLTSNPQFLLATTQTNFKNLMQIKEASTSLFLFLMFSTRLYYFLPYHISTSLFVDIQFPIFFLKELTQSLIVVLLCRDAENQRLSKVVKRQGGYAKFPYQFVLLGFIQVVYL